jgi:hypothetical protein
MPQISDLLADNASQVSTEVYALVYAPRRQRNRFPANCVFVVESETAAYADADPTKSLYPAKVFGPSRSSEGVLLYYLIQWLA